MTLRTVVLLAWALVSTAHVVADQPSPNVPQPAQTQRASTPTTAPAPAPATVIAPALRRTGQPINIKVDVTISDQLGAATPVKKTVSVVTGDNMNGFIRTQATYSPNLAGDVSLNVDTEPEILNDGKIRLRLNLQYDLPGSGPIENTGTGHLYKTQIRENLALILENGKSLVAAQSADPAVDRQVTIEVKATLLK